MSKSIFVGLSCWALLLAFYGVFQGAQAGQAGGLTLEEALASGECDDGDALCLEELMAASADSDSRDGRSKDDGKSKDDKGSKDDGKSKDDNGSKDDGKSKDDNGSKDDDKSGDDKDSKDDGKSKDDMGSKDDGKSKDDNGSKDDGKSKDDKGSKDDDKSKDDKGSKDDDKSGDDKDSKDDESSDDENSKDDDSSDDQSSDDDSPPGGGPLPSVSIGDGQGTEFNNITEVPVALSITLDMASSSIVTVNWATEDGTANAGSDYIAAAGQLSFAPGVTSASITVFLIGEDQNEPQESFFVRLSSPSGAKLLNDLGEVVIIDDDDIDD